jgi:hypothetical protein
MNDIDEKLLEAIMPRFRTSKEAEGQQWWEERQEKDRFCNRYFSREEIDNLDEGALRELINSEFSVPCIAYYCTVVRPG